MIHEKIARLLVIIGIKIHDRIISNAKVELQIQAQVRCEQRFLYKQKSNSPLGHVLYLAISAIDFFASDRPDPYPHPTSHTQSIVAAKGRLAPHERITNRPGYKASQFFQARPSAKDIYIKP